jgi:hypothetical protein
MRERLRSASIALQSPLSRAVAEGMELLRGGFQHTASPTWAANDGTFRATKPGLSLAYRLCRGGPTLFSSQWPEYKRMIKIGDFEPDAKYNWKIFGVEEWHCVSCLLSPGFSDQNLRCCFVPSAANRLQLRAPKLIRTVKRSTKIAIFTK